MRALAGESARVSAGSSRGYLYDLDFPLHAQVEAAIRRSRIEGWDLALVYPGNFSRLRSVRRAGILIWEGDRFPEHWARSACEHLDVAFVPSEFTLEAAVASGIPPAMLRVAPFGVDGDVYRPDGPAMRLSSRRTFTFLAVAAPHIRKGLAELIDAFGSAFAPGDDVDLVIKCPPSVRSARRSWEYAGVESFIGRERCGQIRVLTGSLDESSMASLYRAADVYVQPSFGESFGLAPLEALACGRPIIATGWGGALTFLDRSNSWLVDYDLIDACSFAYDWSGDEKVQMARPRRESLAGALADSYRDGTARRKKGAAAIKTARRFTWKRCAQTILEALSDEPSGRCVS